MAGKGGKGLLATKTTAAANKDKDKDKDKKRPVSRSSRAGIQVTYMPNQIIFHAFIYHR
jgi:histone H2A